jgi:hypothetical protein
MREGKQGITIEGIKNIVKVARHLDENNFEVA